MKIIGSNIILRDESRKSDDDDFFRWLNMEEWNYYDEPDKPVKEVSREDFEKRLRVKSKDSDNSSSKSHSWQIDTTDGLHIGWVNYYNMDEQKKQAYVGICIPEEKIWGNGFGTEALCLLVEHLFAEIGLDEVRTATWTGNKRMIRCSEKSGFKEIIRMPHRTDTSVRGEPLERIEFSIMKTE